jgi:hypothetical protein
MSDDWGARQPRGGSRAGVRGGSRSGSRSGLRSGLRGGLRDGLRGGLRGGSRGGSRGAARGDSSGDSRGDVDADEMAADVSGGGTSGGVDVADDDADDDAERSSDGDESAEDSTSRELVTVEGPAKLHASWDAWLQYFTAYCDRTMQVLPVKETMSRSERNKRVQRSKKGDDESLLLPEVIDPYQHTYICTHGWKKRKSRGEGSRPREHIRLTDCTFRFVVQWSLTKNSLQVKSGHFVHNHPVSARAFATYPSSRGVDSATVSARVDGMLAVGAKRSRIYDYLLEHDQNVLQVDVDNMVRAHTASVVGSDDNESIALELACFAAADKENVSSVADTANGATGVISLATAHMRRLYSRFSEILLVDCTHKTNRYVVFNHPGFNQDFTSTNQDLSRSFTDTTTVDDE